MAKPNETDEIRAVLNEARRSLPSWPKVVDVRFDLGTDTLDEPAVFITLMLDDATKDEDLTPQNLDPIADCIRDAIQNAGVERYPYIRYGRPSEWRAAG